jgi:hypothetical protein
MMEGLQDSHIRATRRDTRDRDLDEGVRAALGTRMDTSGDMTGGGACGVVDVYFYDDDHCFVIRLLYRCMVVIPSV